MWWKSVISEQLNVITLTRCMKAMYYSSQHIFFHTTQTIYALAIDNKYNSMELEKAYVHLRRILFFVLRTPICILNLQKTI